MELNAKFRMEVEEWQEVTVEYIKAPFENALATGPFGSSIGSQFFQDHGIPVIRGSNLSQDVCTRLNDNGLVFVSTEKATEFKRSIVRKGDLIFTCWGTINQIGLIDDRAKYSEYVISNKQMKFTPDQNKADSLFLYYLFSSPKMQDRIKNQSIGSSVPGFNLGQLRAIRFRIPPLPEQKAIAQSLSDVGALITEYDRLITKKRNIKQGTMQQLLTGKKRLPGFGEEQGYKQTEIGIIPNDWNVLELANIVENNRLPSGIYKEKNLYGKGTKIIKLGDVFSLDFFDPSKAQRVILNNNEILSYRVKIGDIFIALASVKLEGVGKVMLVTELDEDTAYDHNVALIRTNELIDKKFIFYLLKSNLVRREISKLSTQVGTTFLKSSTILKFQLPIPSLKFEQSSIATVISDMDAEIEALEQKRDKYKAIKQGMMQELLTGKTRLL